MTVVGERVVVAGGVAAVRARGGDRERGEEREKLPCACPCQGRSAMLISGPARLKARAPRDVQAAGSAPRLRDGAARMICHGDARRSVEEGGELGGRRCRRQRAVVSPQ